MNTDYHVTVTECSITGDECYEHEDCGNCRTANRNRGEEKQQQIDNLTIFDNNVKLGGMEFHTCNRRNTILKTTISEFYEIIKSYPNLTNTEQKGYTPDTEKQYPEFSELKELLHLGNPNHVFFEKDKPAAFVYNGVVYLTVPRIDRGGD